MKKSMFLFVIIFIASCTGLKKAHEFYDIKNYELAIKECRTALEKDSTNVEAYLVLGKSYRALEKLDDAFNSLNTGFQIRPINSNTEKIKDEIIDLKFQVAAGFEKEQEWSQALKEYKYIIDLDSSNFLGQFKIGQCYETLRYLDKSKTYYKKALTLNPDANNVKNRIGVLDSLFNLAEEQYQTGKKNYNQQKFNTAVKYFDRALLNNKGHKTCEYYYHLAKGRIYYKKGGKDECWDAIEEFGLAMMIRPESGEPHYFMAQAYEKKDRDEFDNAIEEYENVIKKEPNSPYAAPSKKKIIELTKRRDKLREFWGK